MSVGCAPGIEKNPDTNCYHRFCYVTVFSRPYLVRSSRPYLVRSRYCYSVASVCLWRYVSGPCTQPLRTTDVYKYSSHTRW